MRVVKRESYLRHGPRYHKRHDGEPGQEKLLGRLRRWEFRFDNQACNRRETCRDGKENEGQNYQTAVIAARGAGFNPAGAARQNKAECEEEISGSAKVPGG